MINLSTCVVRCAEQLPVVPDSITDSTSAIHIADSREGWSEGLRQLLRGLYSGTLRPFDTSDVRPEGSILKTFGGLASGPKPLHDLHAFAATVFREAAGRRLTPLECHDLVCKIGESVVVGGVRRCAPPCTVVDCVTNAIRIVLGFQQAPCAVLLYRFVSVGCTQAILKAVSHHLIADSVCCSARLRVVQPPLIPARIRA